MVQIKQYTRQVLPTALDNTRVSATDIGGDQSGLRALAGSVDELDKVFTEKRQSADRVDYLEKIAGLKRWSLERNEELKSQEFEEGVDIGPIYEADFKEQWDSVFQDIPEHLKERSTVDFSNMSLQSFESGMIEQSNRAGEKAKLSWENAVDSWDSIVDVNPARIGEAREALAEQIAEYPNVSPEKRDAMLDAASDRMMIAAATNLSASQPNQFKTDAKAGKWNSVPNLEQYLARADAKIKANGAIKKTRYDNEIAEDTDGFEIKLKSGQLDDETTADERIKLQEKVNKMRETKNEQALFKKSYALMHKYPQIKSQFEDGFLNITDLQELVVAEQLSPEHFSILVEEKLKGKDPTITDPVAHGILQAKIRGVVETRTESTEDEEGRTILTEKVIGTDNITEALALMAEIEEMPSINKKQKDIEQRKLMVGIANSLVTQAGVEELRAVPHYANAQDAFSSKGYEGQELVELMSEYARDVKMNGVDDLNDTLIESLPEGIFGRLGDVINSENIEERNEMFQKVESMGNAIANKVLRERAIKNNPELATLQGDLPNNFIDKSSSSKKLLSGGNAKSDTSVKTPKPVAAFDTVEEAEASGIKGFVTIGGRPARID